MTEGLRAELLAKTKQALDADDWNAVERLWQPGIEEGDSEAEFQLGYHYLWFTPCDDEAVRARMEMLVRKAAAKDHADAIWFTAARLADPESSPEYERLLLQAGQLGSVNAQRALGVAYATGDWTGPKDPTEATRWYRLAAEKGEALSQYDLGFMILLGDGAPHDVEEGLAWLKRAADQGVSSAFRLLADCYENGYCGVPVDATQAGYWSARMDEYWRDHPPQPMLMYSVSGAGKHAADILMKVEGVSACGYSSDRDGAGVTEISVSYDPAVVAPESIDEYMRTAGISAARPASASRT